MYAAAVLDAARVGVEIGPLEPLLCAIDDEDVIVDERDIHAEKYDGRIFVKRAGNLDIDAAIDKRDTDTCTHTCATFHGTHIHI